MKRVLLGLAAITATVLVPHSAGAQSSADLTLVHGIPGVTVDVAVDGTVVIDNFQPGSLANISSFAGRTLANLTVTDDASGDVVIGPIAELEVPDSGSHSFVAHLDASGDPTITTFENDASAIATGQARVTVRHTAAAPAVDLIVGTDRPVTNASNGDSVELELPVGELAGASLAPTGEAGIADLTTVDLEADTNTIVYAVGSTTDDTLDFVVQVVALGTDTGATTTSTTTSTSVVPTAVNTGSPLDGGSNTLLIAAALGGLTLAGGAFLARRRL